MRMLVGLSAATVLFVAFTVGVARLVAHPSVDDGVRLLSEGRYPSAVRALLAAVAAAPDDARARFYLGLAYSHLGVRAGAVKQLEDAVRLQPRDARFHAGLARAYREIGDADGALHQLEEAARLDPREPNYHVGLAGLLLDRGALAQAVEPLRRAAVLRPRSAEIRLLLATVLERTGDRGGTRREYEEIRRLNDEGPLAEIARQHLRVTALGERSFP
jgi:Flp pilus assembly protein TadD